MRRTAKFALQTASDRPLYLQLVDWLREDIASKAPGERIDSEPRLQTIAESEMLAIESAAV